MTTIKSTFSDLGSDKYLYVGEHGVGNVNLIVAGREDRSGVTVPTADLLAALNAVPAEKALDDKMAYAIEVAKERDRLRAELDEAIATLAAVEGCVEAAENDRYPDYQGAVQHIRAALNPTPAFVLPTEAGARFEAKGYGYADWVFTFETVTALGSVYYFTKSLCDKVPLAYTAAEIMDAEKFSDHRLIEAQP